MSTTGAQQLTDGPVARGGLPHAVLRPAPLDAVRLHADGHLGAWQERNARATVPHCIDALETSGALDNLRRLVGESDQPYQGFNFADSDVYKTLEAVAWESGRQGTDVWEPFVTKTVALLGRVQEPSGYLNSHVQGERPGEQLRDLRWGHELYCLGHLVQAAVARVRTTGRTDLLEIARRFADHVVEVFGEQGRDGLCGHPEVETALVELSRLTGDARYTALAARMVDLRGHGLLGSGPFEPGYHQDAVPVRALTEATGHAVRQLYLAAGVTDLVLETGEPALLEAMERLWASAHGQKTYVTGGMGSRHKDESFGDPFELPPDRAYAETCAGIASVQWSWRMLLATGEGRFVDELERALLNVVAGSTSADGTAFFYSNPLHLRAGHDGSSEYAPSERRGWFSCACCPPNLARLVSSLHGYVATEDATGVQLHLYSAGEVHLDGVALRVRTEYPWEPVVHVEVLGGRLERRLSLRVPGWADDAVLVVDGQERSGQPERGYLHVDPGQVQHVTLHLGMTPRLVTAHPEVDAVRGCVAVQRGPLVHCLEQVDLPAGMRLEDVRVVPDAPVGLERVGPDGGPAGVPVVLQVEGLHRPTGEDEPLYRPLQAQPDAPAERIVLRAVPYYAWGNRGPGSMRVWIPVDTAGRRMGEDGPRPQAGSTGADLGDDDGNG